MKMIQILQQSPVIPVMVIDDIKDAVPLARALSDGGMNVLEITLRTDAAIEAVKQIKNELSDIIIGTGTVINEETYQSSIDANVDFMVSPGMSDKLLKRVIADKAMILPGISTPSEAMQLLDEGFDCMKFFPAESSGGSQMLKSIAGPLPQITFCPTGGISMSNAVDYLSLDNVACVGGSWMLDKSLIADKNWAQITENTRNICEQLNKY
jgi:2-dehydro-3-deoxyphosphogluconate aldolase/(4S)-4-hydroxy-2-oxoglutarate aldolase